MSLPRADMYLVQLLLPTRDSQGGPVEPAAYWRTREELVQRFRGITAYSQSPAQGIWVAPGGERAHDDVIMVEVLAEEFDRDWWRAFGERLASRFDQETIHIRAIRAETPD
jgi:hypothetical protein